MLLPKKYAALAAGLLLMPILAACGPQAATPTPGAPAAEATATTGAPAAEATATTGTTAEATATTGGGSAPSGEVFRWRAFAEPETLDPALIQETISVDLSLNLYESLVRFNHETLEIEPSLAEALPTVSEDGKTYTFKIRKDAKFSNGDPLTAADVKWSWERALKTPDAPYIFVMFDIEGAEELQASAISTDTTQPKVEELSGVKVVDPQTLEVTLVAPRAYMLPQMAIWTFYVVNRNVVEKCPADQPSCFTETGMHEGAGSGPYILERWDHNQALSFKVDPDYWKTEERATVDVEVPIVPDTATAQAQFENGQLDVLDQPDPNDIRRIEEDANSPLKDNLKVVGNARTVWIGMNLTKPPFGPKDDAKAKALREAMNYAIDREQLIDLALQGTGVAITTLMPEGEPGFKQVDLFPFNLETAKAKLEEAGYPGCAGLDLTYTTRDREVEQAVATQIQAQLNENLGCNVQVEVIPWADMLEARQAHQYTMFYGSWGHDFPDPHNWLYELFHSQKIGTGNDPAYNNPEYDRLIDEADAIYEPERQEERFRLYQQAEELMLSEAPIVPLYQPARYWLEGDRFTGYGTNNTEIYPFRLLKPAQ
ncbi:MAG TPA: peptide ABC transporter substrate-binding protein [Chloroflexia bacterium]|nr:peptide ABC transporter substrate-binding protein [Chloroflexia bacterium]